MTTCKQMQIYFEKDSISHSSNNFGQLLPEDSFFISYISVILLFCLISCFYNFNISLIILQYISKSKVFFPFLTLESTLNQLLPKSEGEMGRTGRNGEQGEYFHQNRRCSGGSEHSIRKDCYSQQVTPTKIYSSTVHLIGQANHLY